MSRITSSARFKDAARSRRFLEFIVAETLADPNVELKENLVGIHVFDRAADYDPRLDSIVRVEAGRLRAKLSDYYGEEGREDPVLIELPKGRYVPEFSWPSRTAAPTKVARKHIAVVGALGLIALIGAVTLWRSESAQPTSPLLRIAVLPFTPGTGEESAAILATRLTEKVTAEFVKLEKFSVVPSTSARRFDQNRPGVKEVATALQADILLEARTVPSDNALTVEVRLSDGALDRKFWVSDRFAGTDLGVIARQIAQSASAAIEAKH